ncbi:MAG: ATP-binding protein [Paludibacteraceae bacterium]|nr:ATP-binding protein [Paludibacteraceae bacterium]
MKRKIYNELLKWKQEEKGRVAILIDGARRVGKSYIVKEFAKNEYKSFIFIDFNSAPKDVFALFDNYLSDLDVLFMYLQNIMGVKLYERETLIVFDEVQLCPRARAAIKYLVEDGRYDYIETGSLVSINKNVKDIVIPSEERRIQMFPMDFEEFAWALGDEMLIPFIKHCFDKQQPLGSLMHRKAMDMFKEYMIVGGMPQAVCRYVESNKNFGEVDKVKRDILSLYKSDIEKYASGFETKVKGIFEQLPATLQRHEKKFRLQDIQSSARFREYETSFFWLEESQVVNICWGATEPSLGLRMKMDTQQLKCYMADTGLLISLAFDEKTIVSEEIYKKLLLDKLEINKGMLVENIVAQMLRTSGHRLYFYSQYSNVAEDRMEIDFLIQKTTISNRHNISPIEVKSATRYTLTSLGKFMKKYNSQLHVPYVIHYQDLRSENGIMFLPIYMTPFL